MKTYFRLALFFALLMFVALTVWDIVQLSLGNVPKNFPAQFQGSLSDWIVVALNVVGGAGITGAIVSPFLTLSGWHWPRTVDRWLTKSRSPEQI